jgi:hypothetical protein
LWCSLYADDRWPMAGCTTSSAAYPRGVWPTGHCTLRWCGENRVKGERFIFCSLRDKCVQTSTHTTHRDYCDWYRLPLPLRFRDVKSKNPCLCNAEFMKVWGWTSPLTIYFHAVVLAYRDYFFKLRPVSFRSWFVTDLPIIPFSSYILK